MHRESYWSTPDEQTVDIVTRNSAPTCEEPLRTTTEGEEETTGVQILLRPFDRPARFLRVHRDVFFDYSDPTLTSCATAAPHHTTPPPLTKHSSDELPVPVGRTSTLPSNFAGPAQQAGVSDAEVVFLRVNRSCDEDNSGRLGAGSDVDELHLIRNTLQRKLDCLAVEYCNLDKDVQPPAVQFEMHALSHTIRMLSNQVLIRRSGDLRRTELASGLKAVPEGWRQLGIHEVKDAVDLQLVRDILSCLAPLVLDEE